LRKIDPELVHFQDCEFLAVNCPWPHLLTIHGIKERDALWHPSVWTRWLRWMLLKVTEGYGRWAAKNIILISEYVRDFIGNSRYKQTWLIENPVADSYFDLHWRGERGRIFACGRVIPRKNMLGLIKAFALLANSNPEAQLRIAGSVAADRAYADRCRQVVTMLGLENRVHLLGNLSIPEIQHELVLGNCLVIPSFQETAPLAIEEAMAVGVPIVGANLCGLPYMIEESFSGFLVDPYDVGSIAEAVKRIISDSRLSESMSLRAREISRKRFKASHIASLTKDVYWELLDR
jgi:glycosyltransferase involved in cell wall biosynthesis